MFKILLFCIIGGFVGAFLYHSFRYGFCEAGKDLKFCAIYILSDSLDAIFNLFHAKFIRGKGLRVWRTK
jgi:hypothetical protein